MEKFTDKSIKALKGKSGAYRVFEGEGFCVRVLPSGLRRFEYIYKINGRKRVMSLGNYPVKENEPGISLADAREAASDARKLVRRGIDPQEAKSSPAPVTEAAPAPAKTIKDLAEEWFPAARKKYSKNWAHTMICAVRKDIFDTTYADMLPTDIDEDIALEIIERRAEEAPGATRNLLKAMRAMWKFAKKQKMLKHNPFLGLDVKEDLEELKEVPRKRKLSDKEIKKLWKRIDEGGGSDSTRRALKLMLVLGQRENEICGMHIDEIQFGVGKRFCKNCRRCGWLTIPESRRMGNKGGEVMVFLPRLAMDLIEPGLKNKSGYIFPGDTPDKPIEGNSVANHNRKDVLSTGKEKYYGLAEPWSPHDLRRTTATGVRRLKASRDSMNMILGHSVGGVTGVYDLYEGMDEKELYLTMWADHIENVINSPDDDFEDEAPQES